MDSLDDLPADIADSPQFSTSRAELPAQLRLLCIGPEQPSWINLTLLLGADGCHEPQFRWVSTGREALTLLSELSFDCLIVWGDEHALDAAIRVGHDAGFEPIPVIHSIRSGGYDDPIVFTAQYLDDSDWVEALELDCEVCVSPRRFESRALVAVIKRAIARGELRRDNHRLAVGNHRRLVRERDEAEHLLSQQRSILSELSRLSGNMTDSEDDFAESAETDEAVNRSSPNVAEPSWHRFSAEIANFYHELLRAYVIMGSGGLGNEIAKLAELIAFTGLKPREAMQLHLERVEALVRGLGSRSSRHVMARADLMALELMIHLGECYQKQLVARDESPHE